MTFAKLIFICDPDNIQSQATVLNAFVQANAENRALEAADVAQMQDMPLQQVQQDIVELKKSGQLQICQGVLVPAGGVRAQMS